MGQYSISLIIHILGRLTLGLYEIMYTEAHIITELKYKLYKATGIQVLINSEYKKYSEIKRITVTYLEAKYLRSNTFHYLKKQERFIELLKKFKKYCRKNFKFLWMLYIQM